MTRSRAVNVRAACREPATASEPENSDSFFTGGSRGSGEGSQTGPVCESVPPLLPLLTPVKAKVNLTQTQVPAGETVTVKAIAINSPEQTVSKRLDHACGPRAS